MAIRKLLVKDQNRTFEDKLVTFAADVPGRVLCALCVNICSELLADPHGHLYCRSCLGMLDNDGIIECCVDSATHRIEDMENRSERFLEALKLTATCPNETCSYQGTLREVMTHMEDCDQRPATCDHCQMDCDTFAELRDVHLPLCSSKPVKCPYARLGCNFQASNKEMEKHICSCQHMTALIDRVINLEVKLQEVRTENEQLRQLIAEKEEVFKKTDEYFRANMQEDLEELRTEVLFETERSRPSRRLKRDFEPWKRSTPSWKNR
ncbi:TNF receptor-associated factor 6 isoform X2 [Dermacentor silvarum]|uniref:TNF receptor-associated factor 6 isoform X2 n=1 Tax=Dermacentor silvarum TaxID=543639 RepID=UPI002100B3A5|nr:TNF receptor-associated factor 6 isoform X2 [Dermacentor silvarum]